MGPRHGRRRRHKRHKQRARARRNPQAMQSTLRHVYAPAAIAELRSMAAIARSFLRPQPMTTAVDRLAAKMQRPTFISIGNSNLWAR